MKDENNGGRTGIGFFTLLGLLFIGLKLGGVITWSWWLVTMPIWGGVALAIAVLLTIIFISSIMSKNDQY